VSAGFVETMRVCWARVSVMPWIVEIRRPAA
jgi:hypothetical protein